MLYKDPLTSLAVVNVFVFFVFSLRLNNLTKSKCQIFYNFFKCVNDQVSDSLTQCS